MSDDIAFIRTCPESAAAIEDILEFTTPYPPGTRWGGFELRMESNDVAIVRLEWILSPQQLIAIAQLTAGTT